MNDTPNLLERLENLHAALDEAVTAVSDSTLEPEDQAPILARIDDASGIALEIQTMIDGR